MTSHVTAPEFTVGIPPLFPPRAGAFRRLRADERRQLELVVQANRLLFVLNACLLRGSFFDSPLAASFSSFFSRKHNCIATCYPAIFVSNVSSY